MVLNDVMAIILRYFTKIGSFVGQLCQNALDMLRCLNARLRLLVGLHFILNFTCHQN